MFWRKKNKPSKDKNDCDHYKVLLVHAIQIQYCADNASPRTVEYTRLRCTLKCRICNGIFIKEFNTIYNWRVLNRMYNFHPDLIKELEVKVQALDEKGNEDSTTTNKTITSTTVDDVLNEDIRKRKNADGNDTQEE